MTHDSIKFHGLLFIPVYAWYFVINTQKQKNSQSDAGSIRKGSYRLRIIFSNIIQVNADLKCHTSYHRIHTLCGSLERFVLEFQIFKLENRSGLPLWDTINRKFNIGKNFSNWKNALESVMGYIYGRFWNFYDFYIL